MSSQTVRRPENKRPTRSNKSKKYVKQTARFEGRRDRKPLIFGWGSHLSHSEKVRIQRRATWAVTILFALSIVAVIVGYWVNINIIVPGLPITSVNGHQISQSQYRKLVAYKAQVELNAINGTHGLNAQTLVLRKQLADKEKAYEATITQITNLNKQIKALKSGPSKQRTDLTKQLTAAQKLQATEQQQGSALNQQINTLTKNDLPLEQQRYTQSQIGNDSATWLQDDELIREWLQTQSSAVQAKINPTDAAVAHALNNFKANLPTSTSYSAFLSQDGVSDGDMQWAITLEVRRNNMQSYLASQTVSPAYQVLARTITIDTLPHANAILQQLQQGGDFGKIAKAKSSDTNTNTKGGALGWLARGQYAINYSAAVVENWMFDPHRKLNEISPPLYENGAYHITQILGIDPSRVIDKATLQQLQSNALADWLQQQHALPATTVTPVDQNMQFDPMNMPPGLPATAPGGTGQPGGLPSGLP